MTAGSFLQHLHSILQSTGFSLNKHWSLYTPYIVKLRATNNARLTVDTVSSPILYDATEPTSGHVVDGIDFLNDRVWFGSASTVTGNLHCIDFLSF